MLGQQARQWIDPRTIAAGLTGAGTAMVLGQAGPQVALPEEIITGPGGFFAGMGAGSATFNFEVEAGLAYNELRENGISEDTAKTIALFVGGGNAALELVQTDELVKSIKIFDRSGVTQGFAQQLWQQLVQRMGDVAKETVQEVGQEAVSIGGVQVANKLEKGEWAYDLDEVTDRLKDTGFQSMLTYGLLNVPAGARNIGGIMSGGISDVGKASSGVYAITSKLEPMLSKNNMERFRSEIDGVFDGSTSDTRDISVGETPHILTEYGAPELDLYISPGAVRKIVYPANYMGGKHNLGMSAMKKLPYQLADPIAILRSNTQPDSLVVMTAWKDKNGYDVIVPIHLNKSGAIEPQNSIASAYGKEGISALLGENDRNVLYTKNGEDIHQLLSIRLQLPEAMADNILAKNNISQLTRKVNSVQDEMQRTSTQFHQLVRQLQEAETRRKMPYARMGRELLEMGIVPTDEMLEAMGMSREEARKYVILKQFKERD